jgi:hypothetical protein
MTLNTAKEQFPMAREYPQQCTASPKYFSLPTSWAVLIVLDLVLAGITVTHNTTSAAAQQGDPDENWIVVQVEGPQAEADDTVRFEALDVFVDSGDQPLAAWQVEVLADTRGIEIVGIEGGEHAAFQTPPFYDPRAMNQNRVILASFDTGDDLPAGRSRVARVHVQVAGNGMCEYRTRLTAAATVDGQRIPATVSIAKSGT